MRGVTAVALLACVVPVAAAAPKTLPRLKVTEKPFVVRGAGFRPAERVRITVHAGGRFVRTVFATTRGTFLARFARASTGQCRGYSVAAVGNQGTRASVKVTRTCPPTTTPEEPDAASRQ